MLNSGNALTEQQLSKAQFAHEIHVLKSFASGISKKKLSEIFLKSVLMNVYGFLSRSNTCTAVLEYKA